MAQPNVIVIVSDDQGYDRAGFAGNPDVRTPNLDALASLGVWFPHAICQFPASAPSHATLMTGQYVRTHGVTGGGQAVPDTAPALPSLLRGAGYYTGCVGKTDVHPGLGFDVVRPMDGYRKWLERRGLVDQVLAWDIGARADAPAEYWESLGAVRSNVSETQHATTWIGDQAVRFIQRAGEPFFLCAGFTKPRHPFDPPAPWDELYAPDALALPPGWRLPPPRTDTRREGHFATGAMTEAKFRQVLAFYYASISLLDHQVGRLLATLISRGHTNNVIVYCSGHGDYMGQHGLILKGHARLYDSVLRTPLIVAGLAGQRRGKTSAVLAELADVAPTLLDAAGIDTPAAVEGKSLVSLLTSRGRTHRPAAFAEDAGGTMIVRNRRYKLIETTDRRRRALFDLEKDPYEFDNLYRKPEGAKALVSMQAALNAIGSPYQKD